MSKLREPAFWWVACLAMTWATITVGFCWQGSWVLAGALAVLGVNTIACGYVRGYQEGLDSR